GESHKQKKDLSCISDFRIFSPKLIARKLFEDAKLLVVQRHRDLVLNRNALAGLYMLLGDHCAALNWYQQSINVHKDQVELNVQFGLKEPDDSTVLSVVKSEFNEDEGDGADLDDEDESKPIKPLSIDALQVLHITSCLKHLQHDLEEAKKFFKTSGIIELARERHQHYVRAEVTAFIRAKRKWCEMEKTWSKLNSSFDSLRMSYVIMLEGLSHTSAFYEFKELFPMKDLSSLKKLSSEASPFDYLLVFDSEVNALRSTYHAFIKHFDNMLLPFQPELADSDDVTIDTLVPPHHDHPTFKKLILCKHAPVPHFTLLNEEDGLFIPEHYFPEFDSVRCPVCEVIAFDDLFQTVGDRSNIVCREKMPYEAILTRMYRLSRRCVVDSVQPFYEQLLEWFEIGEKLVRLGRELMTAVQEWINREREIISSCMRFEIGMKVSLPFSSRPVLLSDDNLDVVISAFVEAEKKCVEMVSGALSSLRYLDTLLNVASSSTGNYLQCITCRRPCPVDGTMYVVNKNDELIPNTRLTVKFEKIIRLLKKLIADDFSNKILVFTSIASVIPPFAALLKLLKLPFAVLDRGSRSKTLHRFRHDPDLKILLMPLRMGANGLNLTEANHIVFMEPITETSVLSQAVGRIDRIGQRRTVTVHNFIVIGSIEEEIYNIVNGGEEQSRW
ncbi:hypothetical protein GCK32_008551, partial [Trichostrongylus colubriformis]